MQYNIQVGTTGWTSDGSGSYTSTAAVAGLPGDAEGVIGYATGDLAGALAGVAAGIVMTAQAAGQITLRANNVPGQTVNLVLTVVNQGNGGQGIITTVPGLSLPSASLVDVMYPVGVIYESDDPSPPNVVFGRGTWERITGRMLIGVDENDADFNAAGKTGGEKSHILTANEMPVHNHTGSAGGSHNHSAGSLTAAAVADHNHSYGVVGGSPVASGSGVAAATYNSGVTTTTGAAGGHTHSLSGSSSTASPSLAITINNSTGGAAHNNMPPFRTTYMWRRTA